MSVNDVNSTDTYGIDTPARSGARGRSIAGRALLLAFGFFASLASVVVLVMATLSQMQWQKAPEGLHEKYLPARATPVPPANRNPSPSDVGEVDPNATFDAGAAAQPSYRPTLTPGFGATGETSQQFTPTYAPSFTPSASPVTAPRPETAPSPAPVAAPPAPRAASHPPTPAPKGGGFRRVAGKTFKQQDDGFFVDTSYRDGLNLPVVQVTAGSPEYASLLAQHRELAQFFRLSDRLVLVSGDVVYRVVP